MPGWRKNRVARRSLHGALASTCLLAIMSPADASVLASDRSQQDALISGATLPVALYRPKGCRARVLLFVFAGMHRDNKTYRDDAEPLARNVCGVVLAPRFDEARFPSWQYQRGGVPVRDGQKPAIALIAPLVAWGRSATGLTDAPALLIGHSGGAQFLERVAAYTRPEVAGIIVMNPSTYVLPSTGVSVPYGFDNVGEAESLLRAYLASPITILLGEDDVTGAHGMVRTPEAMVQGENRRERGERTFAMARSAALSRNVSFGWRLGIVPHTGHDGRRMLASPQLREAVEAALSRVSSR